VDVVTGVVTDCDLPGPAVSCRVVLEVVDDESRGAVPVLGGGYGAAMPEPMSLLHAFEVRVVEEPLRLYRVTVERSSAQFVESLRSHYELRRPPRGPENRAAAIHMALSMFD
jgi:hypothetical protein